MLEVHIHAATARDAPALVELCRQLGYPVQPGDVRAYLRRRRGPEGSVLLAVQAGRVVGWLEVGVQAALHRGTWAEVSGLVVEEKSRSQGVGRQLLAAAGSWARVHRLSRLRVRTNSVRERAARFYEREGFRLTKEQRVYDVPLGR
jgi:GNAT superfamily N-acetyltransferase